MIRHTVYVADNARLSELPPESVHLTVTSPPYVTTEFKRGQEFDYDGFLEHFGAVCREIFRVTVSGGRFALNVADVITKYRYEDGSTISRVPLGSDTFQVAQAAGFRLLERYIWDKGYMRNFGGPLLGSYPFPGSLFNNNYFEYVYVLQKPGKRHVPQPIRERSKLTVEEWRSWTQQWWRVESISEKFGHHGAVFPLDIPYRLIRMYSFEGDVVLDPYSGTGATMLAADKCGRRTINFEIDPRCEGLIQRRIEYELLPLVDRAPVFDVVR
jgi:modification methylase